MVTEEGGFLTPAVGFCSPAAVFPHCEWQEAPVHLLAELIACLPFPTMDQVHIMPGDVDALLVEETAAKGWGGRGQRNLCDI